jgi:hypothetical protein
MGGQSIGADSDIYARLYKNVLGARIKLLMCVISPNQENDGATDP